MSRRPRDPRDPYNDPFFNDDNSRNGPFGGFDPFNDPFFKQFEQIQDHIFRDFFGDGRPSIFLEGPNSSNPNPSDRNNNNDAPDLSQINPDAPPSNNPPSRHRNNPRQIERRSNIPSFFRIFDHFFEPEYDDHKLSDINPNLSDNGPIMNNDKDNKGLIHPDGAPPGFRSPYLPNWNGAEEQMTFENNTNNGGPKTFYRSQSVTITTGPDGKTRKTTTIRDSNGQESTTTEEYDQDERGRGGGSGRFGPMIDIVPFNRGRFGNHNNNHNGNDIGDIYNNDNDDNINEFGLWQPNDPLKRFRNKWQNWKWNPMNWYNDDKQNDDDRPRRTIRNDPNIHRNRTDNDNNNRGRGFKWRSYRDYQSNDRKNKPSLLDDIVKKRDD